MKFVYFLYFVGYVVNILFSGFDIDRVLLIVFLLVILRLVYLLVGVLEGRKFGIVFLRFI